MDSDDDFIPHSQDDSDESNPARDIAAYAQDEPQDEENFKPPEASSDENMVMSAAASSPLTSVAATHHTTRKRRRTPPPFAGAPLKRKKRILIVDYVHLLNQDIADASAGIVVEAPTAETPDRQLLDKPAQQIGATRWTQVEKEALFSVVGRLGRDDVAGIAARIGTKSAPEVRQLVVLLSERNRALYRDNSRHDLSLRPRDIPAAVELSQECCNALEAAADDISLRQETREVAAEQNRWGHDNWLVTQELAAELDEWERQKQIPSSSSPGPEPPSAAHLPFAELFVLRNWLKLSERVFLNSKVPDYNWRYFSEDAPSMRATALSDFHGLMVSFTKRVMATALFMCESRIRTRVEAFPRTRRAVMAKDVHAAVDSLGLKRKSDEFWRRAPRRLRLDISLEDEDMASEISGVGGAEHRHNRDERSNDNMLYEQVESSLRTRWTENHEGISTPGTNQTIPSSDEDMPDASADDDSSITDEVEHQDSHPEDSNDEKQESDDEIAQSLNHEAIELDLQEGIHYAADYGGTTRARKSLHRRIVAEHRMEAEAEAADASASVREEEWLWELLRREVATTTGPRTAEDDAMKRSSSRTSRVRRPVYEPAETNWREGIKYVSEWEATSGGRQV